MSEKSREGQNVNVSIIQMELRISFAVYLKTLNRRIANIFRKFNQMNS